MVFLPKVIWAFAESARLKLGQTGNSQESVSKISSSILISFFPQLPLLFFFGFFQEITFHTDKVIVSIMIALVFIQLVLAFKTTKIFIRDKTQQFYRSCRQESIEYLYSKEKEEAEVAYFSKCAFDENKNELHR